jgi:hypothetical protein
MAPTKDPSGSIFWTKIFHGEPIIGRLNLFCLAFRLGKFDSNFYRFWKRDVSFQKNSV